MIAATRIVFFGFMGVLATVLLYNGDRRADVEGEQFMFVAAITFLVLTVLTVRRSIASAVEQRVRRLTAVASGAAGSGSAPDPAGRRYTVGKGGQEQTYPGSGDA